MGKEKKIPLSSDFKGYEKSLPTNFYVKAKINSEQLRNSFNNIEEEKNHANLVIRRSSEPTIDLKRTYEETLIFSPKGYRDSRRGAVSNLDRAQYSIKINSENTFGRRNSQESIDKHFKEEREIFKHTEAYKSKKSRIPVMDDLSKEESSIELTTHPYFDTNIEHTKLIRPKSPLISRFNRENLFENGNSFAKRR